MRNVYPEPVSRLLTLGETDWDEWDDYSVFGFTRIHIPDLVRLGTDRFILAAGDEVGNAELWAPLHAWRSLVQMHAVEAIPALVQVLDWSRETDTDLINEGLTDALEILGEPALEPLSNLLHEDGHAESGYINAGEVISRIGTRHPETRERAIEILSSALEARYERNDPDVNGFLLSGLLDLKAVKSYPLLKKVFEAGRINLRIAGDLEDVEIEFGMRKKRDTPPPNTPISPALLRSLSDMNLAPASPYEAPIDRKKSQTKKEKSKHKQEKKSRKRNRKRK